MTGRRFESFQEQKEDSSFESSQFAYDAGCSTVLSGAEMPLKYRARVAARKRMWAIACSCVISRALIAPVFRLMTMGILFFSLLLGFDAVKSSL